jgi:hypothetical protein
VLALGWLGWTLIGAAVLLVALVALGIACYPRDNSF